MKTSIKPLARILLLTIAIAAAPALAGDPATTGALPTPANRIVGTWLAVGQVARTTTVTTAPAGNSWLDIAKAELGIHEDALPGQHAPRILEYHKTTTLKATTDETPWCSSFVNWVMTKAGRKGTNSAAARSWLDWGATLTTPVEGAVAVIKKKTVGSDSATGSTSGFHVAFYISLSATHIRLLGGNQSDQVKYSNFALSAYDDWRRLAWAGAFLIASTVLTVTILARILAREPRRS